MDGLEPERRLWRKIECEIVCERVGGGGGAGGFLAGCQLPVAAALQHVNMSVARETGIASTATRRTETAAVVSFRIFKRSESIQALGGGWAAAARIPIHAVVSSCTKRPTAAAMAGNYG